VDRVIVELAFYLDVFASALNRTCLIIPNQCSAEANSLQVGSSSSSWQFFSISNEQLTIFAFAFEFDFFQTLNFEPRMFETKIKKVIMMR